MADINLIAAIDNKLGIAKDKRIPWNIPSDRKYFQDHVSVGPVLMGWNTYLSNYLKPYGNGKNYVLVDKSAHANNVEIIHDLEAFMASYEGDLWVAGGGQVFASILKHATHLYLTRVKGDFSCDTFFPEFEAFFTKDFASEIRIENNIEFHYEVWART